MTKISMNWEDLTLRISGHAGGGEKGNDIICAGISALTFALVNALEDASARGRTRLNWKEDREKAEIRITAVPFSGYITEIRAYYRVIIMGMKAMAEEYPDNIKIGEVWSNGNL